MSSKAAITVLREPEDVRRLWQDPQHRPQYIPSLDEASVTFRTAPGDRGTEIHVDLGAAASGKLAQPLQKVRGTEPVAKVKDDLRRFKQHVETGEIARSDGTPEGEMVERKLKQRPAQPLDESELEKAGV
jgi:hypothetical protein